MKKLFLIFILLLTLITSVCAIEFPVMPAIVKGEINFTNTTNRLEIPAGTLIKAYSVNDELYGSAAINNNSYILQVAANNENEIIKFKMNNLYAEETYNFTSGEIIDLNLIVISIEDDTTTSPSSPSSGGGGGSSSCTPVWQCTAWTVCSQAKTQTRTCTDKNNCGITTGKSAEIQTCNYVPPKTTTTQEKEKPAEPETTSGEDEPALTEGEGTPETTGTAVTEPSGGFGGITGMFFQNITSANKWKGLGVIILVLLVGWLFYFFVLKKKPKKK